MNTLCAKTEYYYSSLVYNELPRCITLTIQETSFGDMNSYDEIINNNNNNPNNTYINISMYIYFFKLDIK